MNANTVVTGDLNGRTAIVTGAASGMGAATAILLAQHGANIAVVDVSEEAGAATVAEIETLGGTAAFVRCDVSVEADVESMIRATVETFGRIDCAVNNAAVPPDSAPVSQLDITVFDRILQVDLRGVALCLKHEVRQFLAQGESAAIVNVGSVSSVKARPLNAAYVAAKHGVVGLTKVAALENARHGIRVNAVLPGAVDTPMLASARAEGRLDAEKQLGLSLLRRIGTPEEIAEATLWLCSDRSSYVTGQTVAVDGGYLIA